MSLGERNRVALSTNALSPAERADPATLLTTLERLRCRQLHVNDVAELGPATEQSLAELGARFGAAGVELSLGAQFISPTHPGRNPVVRELARGRGWINGLIRLVEAAAEAGARTLLALVGHAEDRLHPAAWAEQLTAVRATLCRLVPVLHATGTTLALKCHPELNTTELLGLVAASDPAVVSVAYDPVNLVTRGEDPAEAAGRLREHVAVVLLDDMVLIRAGNDVVRVPVPLGQGDVHWDTLLDQLPGSASLLLDLKRVSIRLRPQDSAWCAAQQWSDPGAARERLLCGPFTARAEQHTGWTASWAEPIVFDEPWTRRGASLVGLERLLEGREHVAVPLSSSFCPGSSRAR